MAMAINIKDRGRKISKGIMGNHNNHNNLFKVNHHIQLIHSINITNHNLHHAITHHTPTYKMSNKIEIITH
jgi:hypothetical protein